VAQVSSPFQPYGVTSDKYLCSADLATVATSLGAVCQSGNRQYDQVAGGNKNLKPEKSIQGTFGIVVETIRDLTLGADLWHVGIHDAFGQIPEQTVFKSPKLYPNSFTTAKDVGTGTTYVAFLADNKNLGNSFSTGLDLTASLRSKTQFGELTSQLNVTYMIRESQQLLKDGAYYSAIGVNSDDLGVITFRYQGSLRTSLKTGNWVNTLGVNFKSGFVDTETAVDVLDGAGNVTGSEKVKLKAGSYATFDWQTKWQAMKNLSLTLGVVNLADKSPPLTLSTGGSNKGQQFGYDDRYYDPRGRTIYGNVSVSF
jgi:iron complex outermembrane receptor protein